MFVYEFFICNLSTFVPPGLCYISLSFLTRLDQSSTIILFYISSWLVSYNTLINFILEVVSEFLVYIISYFLSIYKWCYATLHIVKESYQSFCASLVCCGVFWGVFGDMNTHHEIQPLNEFWHAKHCIGNSRPCVVGQMYTTYSSGITETLCPLNNEELFNSYHVLFWRFLRQL